MGVKRKTSEQLDGMIEHVRYEVVKLLDFATVGNAWCGLLRPDLGSFAAGSVVEAGLIHARCVVEFLGGSQANDQVRASNYVPGWRWSIGEQIGAPVEHLHGRLAHLGLVRLSVATSGDFSWADWLTTNVPGVLVGFRSFLDQLRDESEPRDQLFVQPSQRSEPIDWLAALGRISS